MGLPQVSPKNSYRTGRDDLVKDFYVPCLQESVLYRRSAGYFSSHGLALAARGVAHLVTRGGKMKLVVSPHLEPDDVDAIQSGLDQPGLLRAVAAKSLADLEDELVRDRLNALAWLAATGHLEIRLALRVDDEGQVSRGLYHEKVGIFSDDVQNHVAFSGSSNETAGGLLENFESIEVFRSWNDPDERVDEKIVNFEALWENTTPGLKVIDFSKVSCELLEAFRDPSKPPPGYISPTVAEVPRAQGFRIPPGFDLRDYQAEAIRAWSKAGGQGILAMATGAGKTLTALYLASKVAEKNSPLVLIVVCPFINLCRQWIREMAGFGLNPVACFEGRQRWETLLEEEYQRLASRMLPVIAIVTTNATFQSDAFQARIKPRVAAVHYLRSVKHATEAEIEASSRVFLRCPTTIQEAADTNSSGTSFTTTSPAIRRSSPKLRAIPRPRSGSGSLARACPGGQRWTTFSIAGSRRTSRSFANSRRSLAKHRPRPSFETTWAATVMNLESMPSLMPVRSSCI